MSNYCSEYNDLRLLTKETLEELGFEINIKAPHTMSHKYLTASKNNAKWSVYFTYEDESWETVGPVKLLIEALEARIK